MLQDIEEIKEMERAKSHSHGRHFMDQHGGHFDTSFYTEYTGQSYLTGAHAVEIAPDTITPIFFILSPIIHWTVHDIIDCMMYDA